MAGTYQHGYVTVKLHNAREYWSSSVRRQMARKRDEEIADLKKRLRAQTDLYMEAEPLLPIAEALRESINARLLGEQGDSPLDVDGAFHAAVAEVAEHLIASRLQVLDPETVLRLYAELVGDDALREKLGSWAAAKMEELDFERCVAALRGAASRTGRVALEDIEEGTRLAVGMFDPLHVGRARRESSIPPSRTITFRLLEPSSGRAEVVGDVSLPGAAREQLTALSRGTVGSLTVDGERRWLEPALQLHCPLGYDFGAGPEDSDELIGFVEVGDGLLVLG